MRCEFRPEALAEYEPAAVHYAGCGWGLRAVDPKRHPCEFSPMIATLEQVTKEAMDLSPRQKLALAEFLLESADGAIDPEAEPAWDAEIRDRIRSIDEGRVAGVPYEDVMRSAEARLVS